LRSPDPIRFDRDNQDQIQLVSLGTRILPWITKQLTETRDLLVQVLFLDQIAIMLNALETCDVICASYRGPD
jgi:hypothetical protein